MPFKLNRNKPKGVETPPVVDDDQGDNSPENIDRVAADVPGHLVMDQPEVAQESGVLVQDELVAQETTAAQPEPTVAEAPVPSTAVVVAEIPTVPAPLKKLSERTAKVWRAGAKAVGKDNALLPNSPNFPNHYVIKLIVTTIPKRGKQEALRYAKYKDGMTVEQYVDVCSKGPRALTTARISHLDLKWDVNHGFIRVEAPEVGVAPAAIEQAA